MDYRRTSLNGELEGKKFKYGDLKLEYKEEDIVSIKMYAFEGYSHKAITFENNIILYFRETSTQMYYFLSTNIVGECYKTIYHKSSEKDDNLFNRERHEVNLYGIDYYVEFENESCDGFGLLNSNEKKVFIPVEDNKHIIIELEELNGFLTRLTELDEFICYKKIQASNYESAKLRVVEALNLKNKFLEAYKFNNSYYLNFKNMKPVKVQTIGENTFISFVKNIPLKANALYKTYICQKRTEGVTDIIDGAFGYFSW